MAAYYLDTSATVKLYVQETGTRWLRSLVAPRNGHDFHTVRVTGPEFVAAIYRKARVGQVTMTTTTRATTRFRSHWTARFRIIEVTPGIAEAAMDLAQRYGLRGYDSVHLAAAGAIQRGLLLMRLPPLVFISADNSQLQAASAEGLQIDNPDTHP